MKSFKRISLLLIGILIGVAIILFCLFNQSLVEVDLYIFKSGNLRLWFVVLGSVAFGLFLSGISFLLLLFKHMNRIRKLKKEVVGLNKELTYFRNLPLEREAYGAMDVEEESDEEL